MKWDFLPLAAPTFVAPHRHNYSFLGGQSWGSVGNLKGPGRGVWPQGSGCAEQWTLWVTGDTADRCPGDSANLTTRHLGCAFMGAHERMKTPPIAQSSVVFKIPLECSSGVEPFSSCPVSQDFLTQGGGIKTFPMLGKKVRCRDGGWELLKAIGRCSVGVRSRLSDCAQGPPSGSQRSLQGPRPSTYNTWPPHLPHCPLET